VDVIIGASVCVIFGISVCSTPRQRNSQNR
jgi:hypothetical protein